MTKITTDQKKVDYSAAEIFQFLSNFNHFKELLPADKIDDWESTEDSCSFKIKGMATLGLKLGDSKMPNKVVMLSHGKVPFNFTMNVEIQEADANASMVNIDFEGDINPFMKMMIEKPLTNFFNMLVDKLVTLDLKQLP